MQINFDFPQNVDSDRLLFGQMFTNVISLRDTMCKILNKILYADGMGVICCWY